MITEWRWCEDCEAEVEVYGYTEGSPYQTSGFQFVMQEAPEHEGHDIS